MNTPRIEAMEAPFEDDLQKTFDRLMPAGMKPLIIFKTMAKHRLLFDHQMALGGVVLYKGTLDRIERELILHRTCARCGSEYEWGVHVNAFARPLGISEEKIRGTVTADWNDPVWTERESILIRLADELHDTATVSDELWAMLSEGWSEMEILEMIAVCGNYHGVSFLTNAVKMNLEANGERFPK